MQQSPSWEANRYSVNQEIPSILWNPNFHYRIHKRPLAVSVKNQTLHVSPYHVFKMRFNIILQSTLTSSTWPLSLRLPHQTPVCTSPVRSKPSLYLTNSLATALSNRGLYRLFTFHVPNFMSLSLCLQRIERWVQVRGLEKYFITSLSSYDQELLALHSNPKIKEHPLSVVRDCLFNIFAATLQTWGPFLRPQPEDVPRRDNTDPPITKPYYTHNKH